MKPHTFRPSAVNSLEDRMVPTAFATPLNLVMPPAVQIRPSQLVVTLKTEYQVSRESTAVFARFEKNFETALSGYAKALAKSGADTTAINAKFEAKVAGGLGRLDSDLLTISRKLPFGGKNLAPVLMARVSGPAGVTDAVSGVVTPSLQSKLEARFAAGDPAGAISDVGLTQTLVVTDIYDYLNLGVTEGDFKLSKDAFLPALSSPTTA